MDSKAWRLLGVNSGTTGLLYFAMLLVSSIISNMLHRGQILQSLCSFKFYMTMIMVFRHTTYSKFEQDFRI